MYSAVPVLLPVRSLDMGDLKRDGKNIYGVERREEKKSIQLEYSKTNSCSAGGTRTRTLNVWVSWGTSSELDPLERVKKHHCSIQ